MRRTTRSALAVTTTMSLAGLAALTGCTNAGTTSGGQGGARTTLTLGMTQDIQGWDPTGQPSYQGWAASAVYDGLMRCGVNGQPEPDVATSWSFAPNNMGVTARLRSGMKFSDGSPVDAAAVKANFEYAKKHGGSAARFADMKVTTPDKSTVKITLSKPNPLLTARLCEVRLGSPEFLASGRTNKAPVGSGPYTLDASATTAGSVYAFTKNDAYWDSKRFPYKKLVIKVITSETAAINALKTGQIDGSLITQATYSQAEAAGLKVQWQKSEVTRLLITDHLGKQVPALGKVDVRRAMNRVFDKDAIAKNLYRGLASPTAQIFRAGTEARIDDLKDPYPYDVTAAKALMAKAGYANGFTLEMPYLQGQGLDALMPVVKQQLGLINIKVKQVTLSGPNAIGDLLSGKYPVPMWALGNYADSRQDISDYVLPDGIWNVKHQQDATVNELWKKIAGETSEQSAKDQQALNRYVIDQAWFVPMVDTGTIYASNPKVKINESTDPSGLHPQLWDFQ